MDFVIIIILLSLKEFRSFIFLPVFGRWWVRVVGFYRREGARGGVMSFSLTPETKSLFDTSLSFDQ